MVTYVHMHTHAQEHTCTHVDTHTATQNTCTHTYTHTYAQHGHLNLEVFTPVFLDGKATILKLFLEFMERITWATFPPDLRPHTCII